MFFLAAAAAAGEKPGLFDANSIANQIGKFLPLDQLVAQVDKVMPTMDLIGVLLIIIATVHEIPRTQGGEFFNVIVRAIIALAVMAIITPLMWGGEVLVQNLVVDLTGGPGNFVKHPLDFTGFGPVGADKRAMIIYDFHLFGMFDNLKAPPALAFDPNIVDDLKRMFQWLSFGCMACLSVFVFFVMTLMLYVQKAILIFGLLLMPPFIGLQTWQGSARFLGVHYIQSMLGVLCWPIGWAFIYIGNGATTQKLQDLWQQFAGNNGTVDIGLLIALFANSVLTSSWMIIGTIMAPGLINKVITAGGNFAASAMGAISGKAVGAVGDTIKGATAATGAVVGAAVAGPAGAQVGSQLGSSVGAVAAAPSDSVRNSITQATGEGGGGAAPSGASFDAGLAALAQTGKGRGGTS